MILTLWMLALECFQFRPDDPLAVGLLRIFLKILLVICFGQIEIFQSSYFRRDGLFEARS